MTPAENISEELSLAIDLLTQFNLLVLVIIIFIASLISLRLGLSVAIIEIVLGAVFGNLGFLQVTDWMTLVASLGGILLTFLAGTEININLMREKYKESFLIGFCSFLAPFIGVSLYTYFIAGWNLEAALIAGIALSTTSLAVVYSVLIGVVVASAVIPTFIAQKWFLPRHREDIVE